MVKYMKIFNDIRNFIDNNDFKIIIYNNLIDIINYKDLVDISTTSIKIKNNNPINIIGKDLYIIKMLDNELLIKGTIKDIKFNE